MSAERYGAYSVLMSVYSKENPAWLKLAIESIQDQTLPTSDFVLVCDGPLTPELDGVIAEKHCQMGEILMVVRLEKNVGLGNALNEGIKHCRNELVARMDSDDIAYPDRCEKQVAIFNKYPIVSICSGTVMEFSKNPETINCKRVLPEKNKEIIEFAKKRNPFNHPCVMYTYQELYPQYAEKIKFYIGDVRDYRSIDPAFRGVDYVFHAAALKQVPSCEFYPMEAVKTNVAGSDNVISACVENHVKKAIFLSTDKAAYPINAMGMTKAVMEKNVIARSRQMLPGDPVLCLTRYGNVMASRGSVIPLFCDQIDEGKPLTITNPNMTRFMMTLSDAVDLVLYAFEHGEQGDLFVQKAPAATIETLAQAVLELKHSNLGTTIIGTRHGEKLFEVLVTAEEMMRAEELPGFFRIPADNRDLNYDNYFSKGNPEFGKIEQYTSHNTHRLNVEEMKQLLLKLKLFGGTC